MVGETWDNWQRLRRQDDRARARQRHDLPDGAAVQHGLLARTFWATTIETPVADWPTKRAWVDYAFDELAAAGYARVERLHDGSRSFSLIRCCACTGRASGLLAVEVAVAGRPTQGSR